MKGRWIGLGATAVVGLLLVALLMHVYVTAYGTGDPQAERAAALKAAHHDQMKTKGKLLVAAYTPNSGSHKQSNTGHSCFGRTVEVRMVWKNADFGNAGPGDDPQQPQAAVLTVDATSGTVCFVSTIYGSAAARLPAGYIYLYGPRTDLLSRER